MLFAGAEVRQRGELRWAAGLFAEGNTLCWGAAEPHQPAVTCQAGVFTVAHRGYCQPHAAVSSACSLHTGVSAFCCCFQGLRQDRRP